MPSADSSRVLIVGCGASLRRDDQAGLRIGELLAAGRLSPGAEVSLAESPAVDIPALLEGRSDIGLLVIIDAATAGEHHPPGTWRRFDCAGQCSSRRFSLRAANPAPSGATDTSPGRKPWVSGPAAMFEPRRGDRTDPPEIDLPNRSDGSKGLSRDEELAPAISRCHTGSEAGSTPRRASPYDLHGPGVEAAIELCATLGILPAEVWVYAVAAADTGYGEELSAPVAAAIGALTDAIREDVRGWLAGGRCESA